MLGEGGLGLQVGVDSHDSDLIYDLTRGLQNLNMLSHPNATLAPQARASGVNLNYVTQAPQARLSGKF